MKHNKNGPSNNGGMNTWLSKVLITLAVTAAGAFAHEIVHSVFHHNDNKKRKKFVEFKEKEKRKTKAKENEEDIKKAQKLSDIKVAEHEKIMEINLRFKSSSPAPIDDTPDDSQDYTWEEMQEAAKSNKLTPIFGLVAEEDICIVMAKEGVGKTRVVHQACRELAKGQKTILVPMNQAPIPHKVFYINFEMRPGQLPMGGENPSDNFKMVGCEPDMPSLKKALKTRADSLTDDAPVVFVVDTLSDVMANPTAPLVEDLYKFLWGLKKNHPDVHMTFFLLCHTNGSADDSKPLTSNNINGHKLQCKYADSILALGVSRFDNKIFIKTLKTRLGPKPKQVTLLEFKGEKESTYLEFAGEVNEADALPEKVKPAKSKPMTQSQEQKAQPDDNRVLSDEEILEIAQKVKAGEGSVRALCKDKISTKNYYKRLNKLNQRNQ